MKVIFLDVDGVLNSQQLFEKCEDDQLISVDCICWHFTGIVDVIYKSFFLLIIHGKKGQAMAYAII